ncbi:hypothetical protein [Streptomyces sp. NPDC058305]|uniref:hypothetical protein n=1 Tax=Streptomyces sp. NPDC058305 TaxID=3346438 RepID=UPI0036DFD54F
MGLMVWLTTVIPMRWGDLPRLERPWTDRVLRPTAALGNGWSLLAVSRAPGSVRRLPSAARLFLFRWALRPAGGWWLRDRVEGIVPVRTGCYVTRAERDARGGVRLHLAGGGPQVLGVDHVLAATGYRLDLGALAFLSPGLREQVRRVPGSAAPRLSDCFESSLPGLYFTGSLAAATFGPVMRFGAGSAYAACRITRHTLRTASAR